MRVLVLHNYYQQAGGEDAVVAAECELLEAHGHDVQLFSVTNDGITGLRSTLQTVSSLAYSKESRRQVAEAISRFQPDVVHAHNLFPILTPAVYDACRDAAVAVVQTLHNYRALCAGAMLLRNDKPCEKCIKGAHRHAVFGRCYRNSAVGTAAVAKMLRHHSRRGTWQKKVDRFIALTEFAKSRFIQGGFPEGKIAVKPNFTTCALDGQARAQRSGALFVGRLSAEKGIMTLLEGWHGLDIPLTVVGDGPLLGRVCSEKSASLSIQGRQGKSEIALAMDEASYLVMPSVWYEGFPMVLVEAFSRGLPVVVSRLGSMAEIVEDGITGLHFTPGDAADLRAKVEWASKHPREMLVMGENARRAFERRYCAEENYRQLLQIYRDAVAQSEKGRRQ